ncbi:MAG: hypothetical protein ACI4T8_03475 [Christensenellales bacterium]
MDYDEYIDKASFKLVHMLGTDKDFALSMYLNCKEASKFKMGCVSLAIEAGISAGCVITSIVKNEPLYFWLAQPAVACGLLVYNDLRKQYKEMRANRKDLANKLLTTLIDREEFFASDSVQEWDEDDLKKYSKNFDDGFYLAYDTESIDNFDVLLGRLYRQKSFVDVLKYFVVKHYSSDSKNLEELFENDKNEKQ